eukprot:Clim_evm131s147 gene=Clim_evmTU131s147
MSISQLDTKRLSYKKQSLDDAYSEPDNFLEIEVTDPQIHGDGRTKFVDYQVVLSTNLPVFKLKHSEVRRRYSEFEWLKQELEKDGKILVPPLPGKALNRAINPFRKDEGLFDPEFIERRRRALEVFLNKIAGHPLAQNERALHMFLQEERINRAYTPGKVR